MLAPATGYFWFYQSFERLSCTKSKVHAPSSLYTQFSSHRPKMASVAHEKLIPALRDLLSDMGVKEVRPSSICILLFAIISKSGVLAETKFRDWVVASRIAHQSNRVQSVQVNTNCVLGCAIVHISTQRYRHQKWRDLRTCEATELSFRLALVTYSSCGQTTNWLRRIKSREQCT